MRSSAVQQLVLKLLQEEHSHFTAQEVYTRVIERLPGVNQSTVYRTLERLKNTGKVSVSDMGLGAAVFEMVANPPHHHLVCQNCHKVITLDNEVVQPLFDGIENKFNYQLTTNHLILFGYCPECRE